MSQNSLKISVNQYQGSLYFRAFNKNVWSSSNLIPNRIQQWSTEYKSDIITTRKPLTLMILLLVTREARGSSGWQPNHRAVKSHIYPQIMQIKGKTLDSNTMTRACIDFNSSITA